MTSEEFIMQQINAGYPIHCHDGVWWWQVVPFYCKPVLPLQQVAVGRRPAMSKSPIGYSHLVTDENNANRHWYVMLLDKERLAQFSISNLPPSKRKRIRKGLKLTEVRRIENIEPWIEDIKNICISTAVRTKHGKPPEYYVNKYTEWKAYILREFGLPKREWWGAFCDGSLIAYHYAVQVDDTMYHLATKSHTDFMDRCPSDAMIYTFLKYCQSIEDCRQVHTGDWSKDKPSLNRFKEYFGFEKVDLPVYARYNPAVKLFRKMTGR